RAIDDSWKLWSVAMQGGGCYGGFVYNGGQVGDKAKLDGQGGDGGACKLLRWLLVRSW
ncbi:hypothetical protein Tco_1288143, partial [Tanacetum coccineum]